MPVHDLAARKKIEEQFAYQLLQLIIRDPKETAAFEMGLVNEDGQIIREPETPEEEVELTLLDKSTFYLRRLLAGKLNRLKNFATIHTSGDIEITDTFMLRGAVSKDKSKIDRIDKAFSRKTL